MNSVYEDELRAMREDVAVCKAYLAAAMTHQEEYEDCDHECSTCSYKGNPHLCMMTD